MFKSFKLRKRINAIKKNLTPREQILFDIVYKSKNGITSDECKDLCGYSMTGWTANRFKIAGAITSYSAKDKTFRISNII